MVLGLIDFLLGGKKKTKVPKNAQVTTPMNNNGGNIASNNANAVPDGQSNVTQNANGGNDGLVFQDSNGQQTGVQPQATQAVVNNNPQASSGPKKSISEVINKIHTEIKSTNETIANIATEMKEIQGNISSLDHRVSEVETQNKTVDEKLVDIDGNMSKFLSLYELVNNQYNPFVENVEPAKSKQILVDASGGSHAENHDNLSPEEVKAKIKNLDIGAVGEHVALSKEDLKSSLLELDTLNIEEAAGDAVPLTHLKSNTNSLVIILSWLEYLVKKVGVEEAKESLRYYTETLKWITPEVFFELDKFIRGMEDVEGAKLASCLTVRDHIVSLYFISKLNEKALDEKLTNAVLQIIKED
jgi:archaellum component FlaD/FlaE